MMTPVAASNPAAVAAGIPRSGSTTTRAPPRRATSAVSSVLPLSTTIISSAGRIWTARDARQRSSIRASLSAGMTTEMTVMHAILATPSTVSPAGEQSLASRRR
jgi:hypothetical protein